MALNAYGKNNALTGATNKMSFVGLLTSSVFAPTSETALTQSTINMTGSKAKGFENGKIVVAQKLTPSVTGLVEGRQYYVVGEATNSFELALEEGGTGVKVTGHALEIASSEFALLKEVSGGSYARVATSWQTAKAGEISDTANEAIKVPGSTTINYAGWYEKVTGGTGKEGIQACAKLAAAETFGSEGEYKVSSDLLEANSIA